MKLPRDVSGQELVKALKKLGYAVTRRKGSHIRLTTGREGQHHLTIPDHDALKTGTLFRGKAIASGEYLLLTLAPQLLTILAGFLLVYQPSEDGLVPSSQPGHVSILVISRLAGLLACLVVFVVNRDALVRVPVALAAVLLSIGLYACLRDPPVPLDDADALVSGVSPAVSLAVLISLFPGVFCSGEGTSRPTPGQRVRHVLALVVCVLPIVSRVYWRGSWVGIDLPVQRVRA